MASWKLPAPNAALVAVMAADAEREGRPFGGWAGKMAAVPGPSAQPGGPRM